MQTMHGIVRRFVPTESGDGFLLGLNSRQVSQSVFEFGSVYKCPILRTNIFGFLALFAYKGFCCWIILWTLIKTDCQLLPHIP
jgi:hypothetical protein